jgi:hypothetical protein
MLSSQKLSLLVLSTRHFIILYALPENLSAEASWGVGVGREVEKRVERASEHYDIQHVLSRKLIKSLKA